MAEKRYQRERSEEGEDTLTLDELGAELAKATGRATPWSHTTLSKFFSRRLVTGDIADAIVKKFPELPSYAYFPRDQEEAMEYEMIRKASDARRLRDAGGITHHLGVMDRVMVRKSRGEQAQRGTGARRSPDLDSAREEGESEAVARAVRQGRDVMGEGSGGRGKRGVVPSGVAPRRPRP
jgi:hypothetical protein